MSVFWLAVSNHRQAQTSWSICLASPKVLGRTSTLSMSDMNWLKYQQLTTLDEAACWYAVDPENPQAKVIAFRPKVKRRKAE